MPNNSAQVCAASRFPDGSFPPKKSGKTAWPPLTLRSRPKISRSTVHSAPFLRFCRNRSLHLRYATTLQKSSSSSVKPKDRKSTRLNSSHVEISYAVFCLKKKKKK